MHEREKSDPAIRAGKPTNKAEASVHAKHGVSDAAESVEQRAGAKGPFLPSEWCGEQLAGHGSLRPARSRLRPAATRTILADG